MTFDSAPAIAALVLAAGLSSRMGRAKMILPWGETTVIGQVVQTLWAGGVQQVVVVTGGSHQPVELALASLPATSGQHVQCVFNPDFANSEMLVSVQAGLRALLDTQCAALLLALGDQPQIQVGTVRAVIAAYCAAHAALVVPSYELRRGHPWLVDRRLWAGLVGQHLPFTLRDFLQQHRDSIHYVNVNTSTILADLDTPEDYERQAP